MVSYPSKVRQALAGLFMASGAAYTAAVKLTRVGSSALAPEWLAGVLPNLVCGAVVPLAAFLSGRAIRFRDFLLFDALVLAGLCGYEVAQLGLPRRTFDRDDVWASGVGALTAIVVGAGIFLVSYRTPKPPMASVVKRRGASGETAEVSG